MARKTTKSGKKEKRQPFNDLLLPILFTVCILPFTVRLKEYDYGYGDYAWHSAESVIQDLYTYYRMWFFLILAGSALVVLAFWMGLYKERRKPLKVFIPFAVYLGFAALSCGFSRNPKAAWLGNFVDLEGFFVLAGYGVIAFYTYQILAGQHDYAVLFRGMGISFFLMSIVGWLQVFRKDPILLPSVQRLIMSEEYYEYYEGQMYSIFSGNNVTLTLYNPNYAVIYLTMFAAVFAVYAVYAEEKKRRIVSAALLLDALVLIWFTYSRAGLVAAAVVALVFGALCVGKTGGMKKAYVLCAAGGIAALAAALAAVDLFCFGGHYIGRFADEKKDNDLHSILTTEDGVLIRYGEDSYLLRIVEDGETPALQVTDGGGAVRGELRNTEDSVFLPMGADCEINFFEWMGEPHIFLTMYDNLLTFVRRDGEYRYVTTWGKEDVMTEVAHVDAGGLEYLGSGRVYIWTRTLPLLPRFLLIGSGPDTFAEVFPQNDYAGKLVYAENPARIMERAHNDYLMKWVQTGLCSLLALLVFYAWVLKKGFSLFGSRAWERSEKNLLALGCLLGCTAYLVCGLFSDSTLYTTPVFAVFLGVVLSAAEQERA